MFSTLEKYDQDIVITAMEIKTYQAGDSVIKEGDDGEELFIVSTGKLRCTKIFPDSPEPKFLKDYTSGEVFGELALMYNAPRAASIEAIEESVCFSLDRDTFNHIVKTAAIERRKKYDGFLQKIEILSTLSPYEREKICDCLNTEYFKKDDLIIREGEEGNKFYLIQGGTAIALKNISGKEEKVFEYKENDYFGELALLEGDKRKATIKVTSEEFQVASITKDSFKRLLGNVEEILKRN